MHSGAGRNRVCIAFLSSLSSRLVLVQVWRALFSFAILCLTLSLLDEREYIVLLFHTSVLNDPWGNHKGDNWRYTDDVPFVFVS